MNRCLLIAVFCLFYGMAQDLSATTLPAGFSEAMVNGPAGGWNLPVGMQFENNGRMYVWEKGGRVWFQEYGGSTWTLLIDISDEVGNWGDFGLLGFALDPNFRVNGYIYLMYVVDRYALFNLGTPGYDPTLNDYNSATIGRITRYTARATDGFSSVDYTTRHILLGETKTNGFLLTYDSHGVGSLVFGTDGTLLASCGEGASWSSTDIGSASETYYAQALADGIMQPKENVGAYRAQLVDSLSGKIVRIDPATGDGIPSNPFYDPANPRAARSRVWALGLRNPYRMTLRPNTGSHLPADGNPGVLYIGNVGWTTWEALCVCTGPGRNFGWPAFEGIQAQPSYSILNVQNLDAPNPLYPGSGCSPCFNFTDLLKQNTSVPANQPPFANPCNLSQKIPSTIPQFLVTPPALDWEHGTTLARTWIYDGSGVATAINVGAAGSPVSGSMFSGTCSIGGVWYTGNDFPAQYKNTYFHADFADVGDNWIKNFVFDTNDKPVAVTGFLTMVGGIVALATHPIDGGLYYIDIISQTVRKITYSVNSTAFQADVIGNTNNGTFTDNLWYNGDWINACRYQAASNMTVSVMQAKVAAITGRYKCAVYSDNGGVPSRMLRSTIEVTNAPAGWQTFPLTSSLALTNGGYYWLAIWSDDTNALIYYSDTSGTLQWGQYNYGSWPDPISTSGSNTFNYCIYAYGAAAPVATNMVVVMLEDTSTNLTLLGGGSAVSYAILTNPTNGTLGSLNANTGAVTYTPNTNYFGADNFGFTVSAGGQQATGMVSITVTNPIQITSIALSNNLVTVTWTAISGKSYRLQFKDSLTNASWTDLSPDVSATGSTALGTNAVDAVTQRIYRVKYLGY